MLGLLAGCDPAAVRQAPLVPSAAAVAAVPLGALPKQTLAEGECGLFLWIAGTPPRLVLMAKSAAPPFARIMLDNRLIDLPRLGSGPADLAADPNARYGDGRVTAAIDVTLEARQGLRDGGVVTAGSLRIDRTDGDGFVVPVSGLLACG
jgi:hypothetical protein